MGKFLSIDRTFGPRFPRVVALIERLAKFPRINRIADEFGHGSMADYIDELERNCGAYRIEPRREVPSGDIPAVLFANHPLGGVDTVAAMQLLLADGKPFKMLTARVVDVPPAAQDHVIPVDPSGRDQSFNGRAMAKVFKGFGRDYSRLYVFPSGLSSRFDLSRMVATDAAWSDAYWRIALRAKANLVPMWFSGHCSITYYVLCLLFGRNGRVALPVEFFRPKTEPLVARIGVPIPSQSMVYFGDQTAAALRAASYSLATEAGPDPALWSTASADKNNAAGSEVSVLAANAVDRDSVLALRRQCHGQAEWSGADGVAQHVVAYAGGRCVGYCRVVPWGKLSRASVVQSAFVPGPDVPRDQRVVEFDELCVHPDYHSPGLVERLGMAMRDTSFASSDATIVVGVVGLAGRNPILASAEFEFARRRAPSPLSSQFAPQVELVAASRHHDYRPDLIRYEQEPPVAGLPAALQGLLALGATFGRSTWMPRDTRAGVLVTLSR